MSKVFVSGANSYVAGHIIAELIAEGYKVVGSVRSIEKGEQVKEVFPKNFEYVVIENILKSDAYDEALKTHADIEGFFNVLSPVNALTDFEKDTIVPAIESVKNLLSSLKNNAPNLKRLVHTSSIVAMCDLRNPAPGVPINGTTWNTQPRDTVAAPLDAYYVSKTLSEKALWEFFEKEKPSFTVNVVGPSLVLGPEFIKVNLQKIESSLSVFGGILKLRKGDTIPPRIFPTIDVRDLAKAEVYAYKCEETSQRWLISSEEWTFYRFVEFMNKKFPELGLPEVPAGAEEAILPHAPKYGPADLGIKYIPGETTFLDSYTDYIKDMLA